MKYPICRTCEVGLILGEANDHLERGHEVELAEA